MERNAAFAPFRGDSKGDPPMADTSAIDALKSLHTSLIDSRNGSLGRSATRP
jgi:hypothetical protein